MWRVLVHGIPASEEEARARKARVSVELDFYFGRGDSGGDAAAVEEAEHLDPHGPVVPHVVGDFEYEVWRRACAYRLERVEQTPVVGLCRGDHYAAEDKYADDRLCP